MRLTGLTDGNLAEQPALEWFRRLGYQTALGPDISPGGARPGAKKGEKYPLLSERRNIIVIVNDNCRDLKGWILKGELRPKRPKILSSSSSRKMWRSFSMTNYADTPHIVLPLLWPPLQNWISCRSNFIRSPYGGGCGGTLNCFRR